MTQLTLRVHLHRAQLSWQSSRTGTVQSKHPFVSLMRSRRIGVSITANPQDVNVLLMDDVEWKRFANAKGSLFGGKYSYRPAMSSKGVRKFDKQEMLPSGTWCIVVERPSESLVFTDKTSVHITVRAH